MLDRSHRASANSPYRIIGVLPFKVPSYRSRVPNLSHAYRSHNVKQEPELHMLPFKVDGQMMGTMGNERQLGRPGDRHLPGSIGADDGVLSQMIPDGCRAS
jgi:hypothetical protein